MSSNSKASPVHFGFVRPAMLLDNQDQWTRYAEEVGAELIGFGDGPTLYHDPYVLMAVTAQATSRVRIGPAITVPFTRHPAVAAGAISTVNKLSGGRAFFGIGPGDFALHEIGERTSRLQELEDYALAVRGLCNGEDVVYQGKNLRLRWVTGKVPLWIAGDGPRSLELAGRVADGVIVGNGATPEIVEWARQHIAAGAEAGGRSIDQLEIWYWVRIIVDDGSGDGLRSLRPYLARYPHIRFRKSMRDKGVLVDDDLAARLDRYHAEYSSSEAYKPGSTYNADLLDRLGLTDWVAAQFVVVGSRKQVVDRLRQLAAAGATNFAIPPTPQLLPDIIKTTTEIGDVFASLRHSLDKLSLS